MYTCGSMKDMIISKKRERDIHKRLMKRRENSPFFDLGVVSPLQ